MSDETIALIPEPDTVAIAEAAEPQDAAATADAALVRTLESLLFVAAEPAPFTRLATTLQVDEAEIERGLNLLHEQLQTRGIRLQRHRRMAQLVTAPEAADVIETYLGLDLTTKLSRAALETLAIIAYRQPVTRPQIEAIRGVNSDGVMRTLLSRGLIEEAGRLEQAGRPIVYGTTHDFLQYFGLDSLDELPPLEDEAVAALAEREQTVIPIED